jgi:hypothetical protein
VIGVGGDRESGRGALRERLPRLDPPDQLNRRLRATLESRRLVTLAPGRRTIWTLRAALLAAGFVLGAFATGLWSRAGSPAGSPASGRASQYVLLLYDDARGDTGAVHVAREREYGRWASELEGARWVGGSELGEVVAGIGPSGPLAIAPADRLAGYFVIEASSAERAAEVARTCPHVRYGGRVVVMSVAS